MSKVGHRQIPLALAQELDGLLEAGLDQPAPTRELAAAVNNILAFRVARCLETKADAARRKRKSREKQGGRSARPKQDVHTRRPHLAR